MTQPAPVSKTEIYTPNGLHFLTIKTKAYREDGRQWGVNCDPKTIWLVLPHFQHFDEEEIAAWSESEHIVTPNGNNTWWGIVRGPRGVVSEPTSRRRDLSSTLAVLPCRCLWRFR